MSRLYIINESDISKSGKRANVLASTSINWGSAGDSKPAAEIIVSWPKDKDEPEVTVIIGETINTFSVKGK